MLPPPLRLIPPSANRNAYISSQKLKPLLWLVKLNTSWNMISCEVNQTGRWRKHSDDNVPSDKSGYIALVDRVTSTQHTTFGKWLSLCRVTWFVFTWKGIMRIDYSRILMVVIVTEIGNSLYLYLMQKDAFAFRRVVTAFRNINSTPL